MAKALRVSRWLSDEFLRLGLFAAVSFPALVYSYVLHGGHSHAARGLTAAMMLDPAWIAILLCGVPIVRYACYQLVTRGKAASDY